MGTPSNQYDSRALIADNGSFISGCVEDQKKVTTSDATVTVLWSSPVVAEGQAIAVRALVVGKSPAAAAAAYIHLTACFRRTTAGNVVIVGAAAGTIAEDDAGTPAIAFAANTTAQTVELRVTGIAATVYNWEAKVDHIRI